MLAIVACARSGTMGIPSESPQIAKTVASDGRWQRPSASAIKLQQPKTDSSQHLLQFIRPGRVADADADRTAPLGPCQSRARRDPNDLTEDRVNFCRKFAVVDPVAHRSKLSGFGKSGDRLRQTVRGTVEGECEIHRTLNVNQSIILNPNEEAMRVVPGIVKAAVRARFGNPEHPD